MKYTYSQIIHIIIGTCCICCNMLHLIHDFLPASMEIFDTLLLLLLLVCYCCCLFATVAACFPRSLLGVNSWPLVIEPHGVNFWYTLATVCNRVNWSSWSPKTSGWPMAFRWNVQKNTVLTVCLAKFENTVLRNFTVCVQILRIPYFEKYGIWKVSPCPPSNNTVNTANTVKSTMTWPFLC